MKISIITVNLNNCKGLIQTINSVLEQTFCDFEYIIIDGGSTDGSCEALSECGSKLSYWVSECDKGIYDGMNKGVFRAQGEYCIFLNAGDSFYCKDTLKSIAPLLTSDIVCGNAILINGQEKVWVAPENIDEVFWRQRNSLCHQSVFIRTELLKKHPYDISLRIASDYKFLFYETIIEQKEYKHINVPVCYYGCDGVSSNHRKSDAEKLFVIDEFVRLGYITEDALVSDAKRLKVGSKRYALARWLLSKL